MPKLCANPTCRTLVLKGYCPPCAQARERRRPLFDVRRLYRTARWRALRAIVLADQPLCASCVLEGRTAPTTEVDHIVPHRGDMGLFWDRRNLQGLCRVCHQIKTNAGQ